jgi:hypothetical protein
MDFFQVGELPDDRYRIITDDLRIVFSEFYTHRRGNNRISFTAPYLDTDYIARIEVSDRVENCANDLHFVIFITAIALPEHLSKCTLSYEEEYVMTYETNIRDRQISEIAGELISKIVISWNVLINRYERSIK